MDYISKNNIKIRSFTNLGAIIGLFTSGLFFVSFIDLFVKFRSATGNEAPTPIAIWLFVAIILAVGGGIFYFFGDSNKHKKVLTIILKAIGLVLGLGFIAFIFIFLNWANTSGKIITDTLHACNVITWVSFVIHIVALLFVIANFVLSIIFVDEEY